MVGNGSIANQAMVAIGPAQMLPTLVVIGSDRRQIAGAFLKPSIVGRVVQLSLPQTRLSASAAGKFPSPVRSC